MGNGKKWLYEDDFQKIDPSGSGAKICPIEVKSSGHKSHKSLDEFCSKFSSRISLRYLIYTKDFAKDEQTSLLPPYMTMFL